MTDTTHDGITDPRFQIARELLELGHWLSTARGELDKRRQSLARFERMDEFSRYAETLCTVAETTEHALDFLRREVARLSAELGREAFADALKVAPELPKPPEGDEWKTASEPKP